MSVLSFLSVFLLIIGLDIGRGDKSKLLQSNQSGDNNSINLVETAKFIGPIFTLLIPENKLDNISNTLMFGGYPYGLDTSSYIGIKIMFLAIGATIGLLTMVIGLPSIFVFLFAVILFFIPTLVIRNKKEKRQDDISRNIPNMVGLLSVAVNAGVELTPAFEAVSYNMPGALGEELRHALREISTGKKRADALRNMARNTGVGIFERFIETINTAEERGGISLSDILTDFNYTLRELQGKKLQEEARKLPTKMQLPLFLCIFGPMLVIILTPVAFTLIKNVK